MIEKVESFRTSDGLLFDSEKVAIQHDVMLSIIMAHPELKSVSNTIQKNLDSLAELLEPLASYNRKEPPSGPIETTLEHTDHTGKTVLITVDLPPQYTAEGEYLWEDGRPVNPYTGERCRVDHPVGTRCPACEDWKVKWIKPEADRKVFVPSDKPKLDVCAPPVADEPEDLGCDCGALLAGNAGSSHLVSCPMWKGGLDG